mgnify:FL=1
MNKKFLSAILFGALMVSSTGTFVSCKDYDDDIDEINKELTDIKSKLSDLESKVTTGGAYVTKIESVEGGLKVSVSDGTSYNLTIAGTPAGSTVVIDKTTGEISIDGTPTGFFATTGATPQGESTAPYVKDGFWYFYDDATKAFVKSEYKASGNAWAVQKGDSVVLHIPNEAGVMQEITLPTSSSALTALNATPSNWTSGKNIAWSKAGADVTWAGKKGNVAAGQLLIGQLSNLVEVAEVSPKSYDLGAQELTLVDVEGKAAPVKVVATPQDAESTAPRAVSMNGKWNLSIEMNETITADNIATAFTKKENGVDRNVKYALAVNGTVMTGYAFVIDTQTDAESKTNKALSDKSITSVVIDGEDGNTVPLGTTILAVKKDNVYDSYIKFEGLAASKAEKAGITVDGMTMTVPATAAGVQGLEATIYALDVTGHISTHTVTLNIASATEAPSESVSPVDIKIIKTGQSFTIDLGDTFANLDANQALSINKFALTTNNKDFFALTDDALSAQNAPYEVCLASVNGIVYKNEKDEEVNLTGASADLRSIKKAVITLGSNYKSGAESSANMFGSFTLTLTLKAGENAVKAIEIPVTVEEPAFGDLYEQNEYAAWADNTYTTALVKAVGNKPSISLENIFVSKKDANGTAITSASVSYTEKVTYTDYDGKAAENKNATALFGDLSASGVKILKDVDNGKELAVNTFKTKASAEILEIKYNTSGTHKVKVTSPEFTVKAKSVFEGASLVYYKAGASVDAIVNTETDMIAPLTGAAEKRNGLALKLGDSEMAVNFANLSADDAATNKNYNEQGKLGQKFTVTKQDDLNETPASTYAIYALLDESENSFGTVTMGTPADKYTTTSGDATKRQAAQQAENNATGIKVTGLEEGQGGTLVLTFKDELGIITTATVKYKK